MDCKKSGSRRVRKALEILVKRLRESLPEVEIALTTNGSLLPQKTLLLKVPQKQPKKEAVCESMTALQSA
jgi:hypothetical protein